MSMRVESQQYVPPPTQSHITAPTSSTQQQPCNEPEASFSNQKKAVNDDSETKSKPKRNRLTELQTEILVKSSEEQTQRAGGQQSKCKSAEDQTRGR